MTKPTERPGFSHKEIKRSGGLRGAPYWDGIRVALQDYVSPPQSIAQALERLCAQQTSRSLDLFVKKSGTVQ
jgi:hypothetical protein